MGRLRNAYANARDFLYNHPRWREVMGADGLLIAGFGLSAYDALASDEKTPEFYIGAVATSLAIRIVYTIMGRRERNRLEGFMSPSQIARGDWDCVD